MACYYPGGMSAYQFSPCNPSAPTSLCCPEGWTCMSDGRCLVTQPGTANAAYPVGTSYRGTCTDPQWDVAQCGDFCLDNPVNDDSGQLIACGNNYFCCAPDAQRGLCNCTTNAGTFSLSSAVAQTVIGVTGLQFTQTPAVTPSFVSTTSTAIHTTLATSIVQPSQSPTPLPAKPKPSGTKIGLGVGLGLGIGLALLIAIAYIIWLRKIGKNPFAGLRIRQKPSSDAIPQPAEPPVDTPYIPKKFASPTQTLYVPGGSRSDLPPDQAVAQALYNLQTDWTSVNRVVM